jgi:hypothetical protein
MRLTHWHLGLAGAQIGRLAADILAYRGDITFRQIAEAWHARRDPRAVVHHRAEDVAADSMSEERRSGAVPPLTASGPWQIPQLNPKVPAPFAASAASGL